MSGALYLGGVMTVNPSQDSNHPGDLLYLICYKSWTVMRKRALGTR